MSGQQRVLVYPADRLVEETARRLVVITRERIAATGRCTVALSGGSTPGPVYRRLATSPLRDEVDWSCVHVFWGDERTVPPESDQSNYRLARETLLDHVPIPAGQIYRLRGEIDPETAAAEYEQTIRRVFNLAPGELPVFDLLLQGIGPDGHTASLFPGTVALHERERLVVANVVPQLNTMRLTLTVPVIQNAARIVVLVAGRDKAEAVRRALEGEWNPEETPSQILRQARGEVDWLLDAEAASLLRR